MNSLGYFERASCFSERDPGLQVVRTPIIKAEHEIRISEKNSTPVFFRENVEVRAGLIEGKINERQNEMKKRNRELKST